VKDETVDLWLPAQQTSAPTQPPGGVSDWIVAALGRSRQEIERIVNHLLSIGDAFKAARCLEIHAQGKLGLEYSGDQILRYDTKDFGIFHQTIFDLLWAASLYQLAKRTRTAQATGVRALLFVEEGIRNITSLNQNDNGELACMAMAFEMAGHCCVAVKASEGLDYYRASERYWSQAARMRPEAMLQWAHHPVTRTVVGRFLGRGIWLRHPGWWTAADSAREHPTSCLHVSQLTPPPVTAQQISRYPLTASPRRRTLRRVVTCPSRRG
jgi:hypothetical protein